jgi:hypothetical protein
VRERLELALEGDTKVAPLPPEIARLQAEVAAARALVPPFTDPRAEALIPLGPPPEGHKPSGPPPIPKSGAPPFTKKPFTP